MYSIQQIASILKGNSSLQHREAGIEYLLTDSRRLVFPASSLFFALKTERKDGAEFIGELYNRGVRNFVVQNTTAIEYVDANIIYVGDPLRALQRLAAWHRQQFNIPVIGVTGSNGKTMVKEWLYQLLQHNFNIVRSPKSYNSQVGVPLSVWQMNKMHTLAIFEAGISQPNEMQYLEEIIKPTIGILTNIGEAHREGFASTAEKVSEKLKLFQNIEKLIFCKDCIEPLGSAGKEFEKLNSERLKIFSWSTLAQADLTINQTSSTHGQTTISALLSRTNKTVQITIPFTDKASIDNAITCWCVMIELGYSQKEIEQRMLELLPLDMRMQLKKGINNCQLINDSYNNDLSSLELALDYLSQQAAGKKTTIILSDIFQSGLSVSDLCKAVRTKARNRHVDRLVLIGPVFFANRDLFEHPATNTKADSIQLEFYSSTDAFLQESNQHHFRDEVILLKGSRVFEFERIGHWLEEKVHQTVLEVNLNAMVHNLKEYQRFLKPGTKLMAMVKAFSYGSGSAEVAAVLQFYKVDYLAVAYADEGVELRKAGIHCPIMVMNPEIVAFDALVDYNLEPELYSFNILEAFSNFLSKEGIPQYPVHLKLDTGMHRLGFDPTDVPDLIALLQRNNRMAVQSVFSHLVASENPVHDAFTQQQAVVFEQSCTHIQKALGYGFIQHLSNSAAIFRHPHLQYDMVRLGIGLYGIESTADDQLKLQTVATLKSTIAQVRLVKQGDSVGYSRAGIMERDSLIATVRIGYADGFSRRLSNRVGSMYLKGKLAPVIGSVCMDMAMIDVSDIPGIKEGDDVEIFGSHLPAEQLAEWCQTIPYEILTGISQRVKRVYYEE
jgi:alanine racemase